MSEQYPQKSQSERESLVSQMSVVTISREYGSGGGEVAQRLAKRLNWHLVDHEVVAQLAHKLGVSEAEAATYDEHAAGFIARLITNMRSIDPAMLINVPETIVTDENVYHQALHQVVVAAAQERHVVIVGRGGQKVLQDRRDSLHIRIIAPLEQRITYVMQRENLKREEAQARIQLKDRDRQRYFNVQYHQQSDDPHLYDLVLNTGIIDLNSIVDIITTALERKATRLNVSEDELGPAACVQRYPGQPGDMRPPIRVQEEER